jgi:dihydropteroate synthase
VTQIWRVRGGRIALDRPIVAGILNITPDSFSDGGQFTSVQTAIEHAGRMIRDGADIIDVGGESTRPQGAVPVTADEEMKRVLPVIQELHRLHPDTVLSIDTVKSEVAEAALDAGVSVVNDVSGFRLDPRMAKCCATYAAGVVLMHSRGTVSEMGTYAWADYGSDAITEILAELDECVRVAEAAGVERSAIAVDPGIGFAKRPEHSIAMLAALPRLAEWGLPIFVGVSRKRFVGEITGVMNPAERVHGSVGAAVAALTRGARIFRVHDVKETRHALDVAWAIADAAEHGAAR